MKKTATPARVDAVRRRVSEALALLTEIDARRAVTISAPLCKAEAALSRWAAELEPERKAG